MPQTVTKEKNVRWTFLIMPQTVTKENYATDSYKMHAHEALCENYATDSYIFNYATDSYKRKLCHRQLQNLIMPQTVTKHEGFSYLLVVLFFSLFTSWM